MRPLCFVGMVKEWDADSRDLLFEKLRRMYRLWCYFGQFRFASGFGPKNPTSLNQNYRQTKGNLITFYFAKDGKGKVINVDSKRMHTTVIPGKMY